MLWDYDHENILRYHRSSEYADVYTTSILAYASRAWLSDILQNMFTSRCRWKAGSMFHILSRLIWSITLTEPAPWGNSQTVRLLLQRAQTPVQTIYKESSWRPGMAMLDHYFAVLFPRHSISPHADIPLVFMIMVYVPFPYNICKAPTHFLASLLCQYATPRSLAGQWPSNLLALPFWRTLQSRLGFRMHNMGSWCLLCINAMFGD